MKWKYVGSTYNDSFILNGVDIFLQVWVNTGQKIKVKDPDEEIKNFKIWVEGKEQLQRQYKICVL